MRPRYRERRRGGARRAPAQCSRGQEAAREPGAEQHATGEVSSVPEEEHREGRGRKRRYAETQEPLQVLRVRWQDRLSPRPAGILRRPVEIRSVPNKRLTAEQLAPLLLSRARAVSKSTPPPDVWQRIETMILGLAALVLQDILTFLGFLLFFSVLFTVIAGLPRHPITWVL
ncbi:hypothetical protein OBBRIDRAFT_418791 [Obba rivulosa]|uniref:Uncharacterized protein n=1 Tax=Obba rivulosa TaxID=1052685 RepID=A0A8E2DLN0_9APHY|nr:hypothetical protein OBBRIDRAFT_418791 [Obba rivulosa]